MENPTELLTSAVQDQLLAIRRNRERDLGFASVLYEKLVDQALAFESALSPTEEIGACLSSFGSSITIRIDRISYVDPFLVVFIGEKMDSSEKVRLVQHTNQINVLFIAIRIEKPREPRRLGFVQTD